MRTTPAPSTAPGATGSFRRRWTIRLRSTGSVTITTPSSRIAAQLCPSHVTVPVVASVGAMGESRAHEPCDLEDEPDTADELRHGPPGPGQEHGPWGEEACPARRPRSEERRVGKGWSGG